VRSRAGVAGRQDHPRALLFGWSDDWFMTGLLAGLTGKIAMILGSIPVIVLAMLVGADPARGFSGTFSGFDWVLVILALLFAPAFESMIVWLSVWLLRAKFGMRVAYTVLLSGLIHVPLHGVSGLSLTVFPAFALHALILNNWRERGSSFGGYCTIVLAHFVQNALSLWLAAVLG